ncbi:MAG: hypothetical protein VX429_01475, partial [Nitrospinota bacterium]|nr:hypothetical protein [Nitrospinota bacterium]
KLYMHIEKYRDFIFIHVNSFEKLTSNNELEMQYTIKPPEPKTIKSIITMIYEFDLLEKRF